MQGLRRPVIITALIGNLTAGCDGGAINFQSSYTVQSANNQTFLVNERSGDVYRIQGQTIRQLERLELGDLRQLQESAPRDHFLPSVRGMSFNLQSKFVDGAIMFRLTVEPQRVRRMDQATKKLVETAGLVDPNWRRHFMGGNGWLDLRFKDTDGFVIKTTHLVLSGIGVGERPTRIVDENGEIDHYLFEGQISASQEEYGRIALIADVTYSLSDN